MLLRSLIGLEEGGGNELFGEPQFAIADLLRTAPDGRGVISCLELPGVQDKPALFSTALMWLLAELFEDLPEAGDLDKPKLVFFFDEAHLLFDDATDAFLDSVAQTVRLIRSKGVGIFFVTQNPQDLPSEVLGQLGSRVQHALRAFTPDDAKALKATVSTYPKSDFYDLEELLDADGDRRGGRDRAVGPRHPDPGRPHAAGGAGREHGPGARRRGRGEGVAAVRALRRAARQSAARASCWRSGWRSPRRCRTTADGARARSRRQPRKRAPAPAGPPDVGDFLRSRAGPAAPAQGAARRVRDAAQAAVRPVPPFTEAHEALRAEMRAFVETELRPHAPEWEAARFFPNEVFAKLAARGWLGLKYGADADWVADAVLSEELARCRLGRARRRDRRAHRDRHAAAGDVRHRGAAGALARPRDPRREDRGARDHRARRRLRRRLDPHPRRAASTAAGSSTAPRRSSPTACARTSTSPRSGRAPRAATAALSFLVIEAGEGVRASPLEKLGWHASDTAEIAFEDVAVPDDALLGEEGRGFYLIVANFQWERLLMSLGAVGSMRATLERVIAILAERGVSQSVRHRVAEHAVAAEAGAAMTYQACAASSTAAMRCAR